jgi:predicted secreted protein
MHGEYGTLRWEGFPVNKMLIALPVIVAGPAMAQDVTFDIEAYCARVADAVGGSYQIEETCRQQEADAREAMRSTEQRIATYCEKVADAVWWQLPDLQHVR